MAETDIGSNWTSERLAELRRRSYGGAAWVDFLRQSLERSAEQRRRLADANRQLRRWMIAWGLAAIGVRRVRRAPSVPVRAESGLVTATWLMVRWHLGMLGDGDATTRERLSGADALTLMRLWLAPRLRRAASDPPVFVTILLLGAVTDVLDGSFARQRGTSRLGRDLDALTDVVFLRAAGGAAREAGAISRLPALVFELRLILGPVYAAWHYFRFAGPPPTPYRRPLRVATAISTAFIAAAVVKRNGSCRQPQNRMPG
jgi:phosphatidylglycerophosphate synthase